MEIATRREFKKKLPWSGALLVKGLTNLNTWKKRYDPLAKFDYFSNFCCAVKKPPIHVIIVFFLGGTQRRVSYFFEFTNEQTYDVPKVEGWHVILHRLPMEWDIV